MIDWWLAKNGPHSATVCIRSDVDGSVSLILEDTSFTPINGVISTTINDGNITLIATGLSPGRSYPFRVLQGTESESGILRSSPDNGLIKIVWGSCVHHNNDLWGFEVAKLSPDAIIMQGDFGYADDSDVSFGEISAVRGDVDNTTANYNNHHLLMRRITGHKRAIQTSPLYYMFDDHEILNNWDWSFGRCNAVNTLCSIESDKQTVYDNCIDAFKNYTLGNPANEDVEIDTAPAALYFSFRIGNAEIFMLDTISYRDIAAATGIPADDAAVLGDTDPTKTMLGLKQLAWFKAKLSRSESDGVTFKIIACNKKTYPNVEDNADGWSRYLFERDALIQWIHDNISNVVFITGDRHDVTVVNKTSAPRHICVTACPLGSSAQAVGQGSGYEPNVVYKNFGYSGTPPENLQDFSYGLLTLSADSLAIEIRKVVGGAVIWAGTVAASDGLLTYAEVKISL